MLRRVLLVAAVVVAAISIAFALKPIGHEYWPRSYSVPFPPPTYTESCGAPVVEAWHGRLVQGQLGSVTMLLPPLISTPGTVGLPEGIFPAPPGPFPGEMPLRALGSVP